MQQQLWLEQNFDLSEFFGNEWDHAVPTSDVTGNEANDVPSRATSTLSFPPSVERDDNYGPVQTPFSDVSSFPQTPYSEISLHDEAFQSVNHDVKPEMIGFSNRDDDKTEGDLEFARGDDLGDSWARNPSGTQRGDRSAGIDSLIGGGDVTPVDMTEDVLNWSNNMAWSSMDTRDHFDEEDDEDDEDEERLGDGYGPESCSSPSFGGGRGWCDQSNLSDIDSVSDGPHYTLATWAGRGGFRSDGDPLLQLALEPNLIRQMRKRKAERDINLEPASTAQNIIQEKRRRGLERSAQSRSRERTSNSTPLVPIRGDCQVLPVNSMDPGAEFTDTGHFGDFSKHDPVCVEPLSFEDQEMFQTSGPAACSPCLPLRGRNRHQSLPNETLTRFSSNFLLPNETETNFASGSMYPPENAVSMQYSDSQKSNFFQCEDRIDNDINNETIIPSIQNHNQSFRMSASLPGSRINPRYEGLSEYLGTEALAQTRTAGNYSQSRRSSSVDSCNRLHLHLDHNGNVLSRLDTSSLKPVVGLLPQGDTSTAQVGSDNLRQHYLGPDANKFPQHPSIHDFPRPPIVPRPSACLSTAAENITPPTPTLNPLPGKRTQSPMANACGLTKLSPTPQACFGFDLNFPSLVPGLGQEVISGVTARQATLGRPLAPPGDFCLEMEGKQGSGDHQGTHIVHENFQQVMQHDNEQLQQHQQQHLQRQEPQQQVLASKSDEHENTGFYKQETTSNSKYLYSSTFTSLKPDVGRWVYDIANPSTSSFTPECPQAVPESHKPARNNNVAKRLPDTKPGMHSDEPKLTQRIPTPRHILTESKSRKLKPAVRKVDPAVAKATLKSLQTGSVTPLVKEELRLTILSRRHAEGKADIDLTFEPKEDKLTEADRERNEEKKKRNKIAAAKCRERRKMELLALEQECTQLAEENQRLEKTVAAKEAMKALYIEKLRLILPPPSI